MSRTTAAIGLITAILGLGAAYLGLVRDGAGGQGTPASDSALPSETPSPAPDEHGSRATANKPQSGPNRSPGNDATIPVDPTDSTEYQDCSRNSGYGAFDCEILREDTPNGEQARSFYSECRSSGNDPASCLAEWSQVP